MTTKIEATVKSDRAMDLTVVPGVAVLFWGGPFSQWYPEYNEKTHMSAAFEIGGVTYRWAEQYMMAEKARLFGDDEMLAKILKSGSPLDIKEFGRAVRNYGDTTWGAVRQEIVYRGNLAKFGQSEVLRAVLLSTGNLLIAEASPDDDLWGIGLAADDLRARNPEQWLGENWLGEALVRVRKSLRSRRSTRGPS